MLNDIQICSLNKNDKKEIIKQGKTVQIRPNFEVYCPEGYQILFYDPNLYKESKIITYKNYFEKNFKKFWNLKSNGNSKEVKKIIKGIYEDYDNFPIDIDGQKFRQKMKKVNFLNVHDIIELCEKLNYRQCAEKNEASRYGVVQYFISLFKKNELLNQFKELNQFKKPWNTLKEEDYKKVMDFLRLRTIKLFPRQKKANQMYINESEIKLGIINTEYDKKELLNGPNDKLERMIVIYLNKINTEKDKELNNYIKNNNDDKVSCIISKYVKKDDELNKKIRESGPFSFVENLNESIDSMQALYEELTNYNLNDLTNKIGDLYNKLAKAYDYYYDHFSSFTTVYEQREHESWSILNQISINRENEEKSLREYEKNSVENPDKIKHQSQVFWPIDVNGNELNYLQHWPIVMAKKEE